MDTTTQKRIVFAQSKVSCNILVLKMGLYILSIIFSFNDPFEEHMTYKPSDKSDLESVLQEARSLFIPHLAWIEFIHSRFNATRHMRKNLTSLFIHLLGSTFRNAHLMRYVSSREVVAAAPEQYPLFSVHIRFQGNQGSICCGWV